MSERTTPDDNQALPYGDERSRVYEAVGGSKRCLHLLFVPTQGEQDRLLPFSDIRLMDVRKDGRELRMDFSERTVILTGHNLHIAARAIGAHMRSRLEAFDPDRHDRPDKDSDPFIETIVFWTRDDERKSKAKPEHEPETVASGKAKQP
jgi:hypothetical protein